MKPTTKLLVESLEFWGLRVDEPETEALMEYGEAVDRYEEANITGARSLHEVVRDHIIDSLSCLLVPELETARNAVDVGSGGGFPAIPLAIVRRDMRCVMVESTGKKAKFLDLTTGDLELGNTEVVSERVEEVGQSDDYRARFDVSTARAVAALGILMEYCLPLLKVGGVFVAMKAGLEREEIAAGEKAADVLGGNIEDVISVPTPAGIEVRERNLVVVRKTVQTPGEYPRAVGIPKKAPLGV